MRRLMCAQTTTCFSEKSMLKREMLKVWSIEVCQSYEREWQQGANRSCTYISRFITFMSHLSWWSYSSQKESPDRCHYRKLRKNCWFKPKNLQIKPTNLQIKSTNLFYICQLIEPTNEYMTDEHKATYSSVMWHRRI
jgi:hypothetical protein